MVLNTVFYDLFMDGKMTYDFYAFLCFFYVFFIVFYGFFMMGRWFMIFYVVFIVFYGF